MTTDEYVSGFDVAEVKMYAQAAAWLQAAHDQALLATYGASILAPEQLHSAFVKAADILGYDVVKREPSGQVLR